MLADFDELAIGDPESAVGYAAHHAVVHGLPRSGRVGGRELRPEIGAFHGVTGS